MQIIKLLYGVIRRDTYTLRWTVSIYHYFIYATKPSRFLRLDYGKLFPTKFYTINAREIIAEMAGGTLLEKKMQILLTVEE